MGRGLGRAENIRRRTGLEPRTGGGRAERPDLSLAKGQSLWGKGGHRLERAWSSPPLRVPAATRVLDVGRRRLGKGRTWLWLGSKGFPEATGSGEGQGVVAAGRWCGQQLGEQKAGLYQGLRLACGVVLGTVGWGRWPCLPAQDPAGSPCSHRDADCTFRKEQDPASPKASPCTGWYVWVGSFHAWAGTNKGPPGGVTPAILSTASSDPTCCHCYFTGATRHVIRAAPTVPQPHQGV